MTANLRIDSTLLEISRGYKPGLLAWLKEQPPQWDHLLQLEDRINRAALAGDETGLTAALAAYKVFFQEKAILYERAEEMPLFGNRR